MTVLRAAVVEARIGSPAGVSGLSAAHDERAISVALERAEPVLRRFVS